MEVFVASVADAGPVTHFDPDRIQFQSLGMVPLVGGAVTGDVVDEVNQAWTSLGPPAVTRLLLTKVEDGDVAAAIEQANLISTELDLGMDVTAADTDTDVDLQSNCGSVLVIVPGAAQAPTRNLRFVVHTDSPDSPSVLREDRSDPVVIRTDASGGLAGSMPTGAELDRLKEHVEAVGGVTSAVLVSRDDGDAGMSARADALREMLAEAGIRAGRRILDVKVKTGFDTSNRRRLWTTPDGTEVDELVLLGGTRG
jgi:hypothetical protein